MPPPLDASSSLLRDRRFVLLVSARTVSVLGSAFARVALAFAVLALPGASAGRLSLVQCCLALPQVTFVLAGGVVADRMSRSRLMVVSDLLGGPAYAGLAVMVLTRHAPLPAMCLLTAVAGTGTALFWPAMAGVVPLLVRADRLQRANATLRIFQNGATLLGLSLSGLVVALLGPGWALAITAASYLASALLVRGLRVTARPRAASSGRADLRDGWREFARRQWLWVVVAQFAFLVAAMSAVNGVLGPLAAQRGLGGARGWSYVVGAQALGTLVGAGVALRLRVRRPILVAVVAMFPVALPMALLAVRAPVWWVCGANFGVGVATDVFGALWAATMQREIPDEVLGRVSAYDVFGSLAFAPLGTLVAGPAAVAFGLYRTLAGCAVLTVLATVAALLSRDVRTLRAPDPGRHRDPAESLPA
ncbi:MFS transporter [Streptomyces sp. SL13]|uniref:MFS transporter n=1 Tax=Streptantibioticus silvisoli TaxID=2705255 RepID=A0AA90JXG2_9ACTN|nr:MFS transporter [Streptantibioticus silvisoli]MDI5970136.1 MFS transporter [Streptantibioticus silvisoli]